MAGAAHGILAGARARVRFRKRLRLAVGRHRGEPGVEFVALRDDKPASRSGESRPSRRHSLARLWIDDHAFTELPSVLDGGAACGVVEHAPHLLGGRKPADGRS